jgi:hypothetical protein
MRKFVIAVGLGVAVIVCAQVARAEAPDENASAAKKTTRAAKPHKVYNPGVKFEQFSKDLALTKAQQEQIKPILDELENKLLPLRRLTLQRLGQRGAPIVKEDYQKIREYLNTEQLDKFNKMVDKGEITPFTR